MGHLRLAHIGSVLSRESILGSVYPYQEKMARSSLAADCAFNLAGCALDRLCAPLRTLTSPVRDNRRWPLAASFLLPDRSGSDPNTLRHEAGHSLPYLTSYLHRWSEVEVCYLLGLI